MAGKIGGGEEDILAEINITPMVDIILVLLIIFMVTAQVINDPGIEVELPQAATGGDVESSVLGLMIDGDGKLYLNGDETTEDKVRAFIRAEQAGEVELQALIAADKSVDYGHVVRVIDLVKQEGVVKFALNIDPAAVAALAQPDAPDEQDPSE